MGLHVQAEHAREMLSALQKLMQDMPFDKNLQSLSINIGQVEKDLEAFLYQHQLEDEFRKIHDLPGTVNVDVPEGWKPEDGKVLTNDDIIRILPGALKSRKGSKKKK